MGLSGSHPVCRSNRAVLDTPNLSSRRAAWSYSKSHCRRRVCLATPFADWAIDDYWSSQRRPASLAYIILARTSAEPCGLIDRLDAPDVSLFVHVDRNTDDTIHREFEESLAGRSDVYFVDRVAVEWGKRNLVEAILGGLDRIVQHRVDARSRCAPKRSGLSTQGARKRLRWFFAKHRGTAIYRLPRDARRTPGVVRKGWPIGSGAKTSPVELQPFRGSTWWALSGNCAAYVKATATRTENWFDSTRSFIFPDEMFFKPSSCDRHSATV